MDNQHLSQVQNVTLDTFGRASLKRIIIKARLCKLLPALSPEELTLAVEAWAELFAYAGIPTDQLEVLYLETMQSRSTTWPLGADEMCAFWRGSQLPQFMAGPKSEEEKAERQRVAAEFEANIGRIQAQRSAAGDKA